MTLRPDQSQQVIIHAPVVLDTGSSTFKKSGANSGVTQAKTTAYTALLVFVQHGFEIGKRIKRSRGCFTVVASGIALLRFQLSLVFIVMAIDTQQFPVTAISGIVVVIVVAMMHSQLVQVLAGKLAGAATADVWIHFQCLLTVALLA